MGVGGHGLPSLWGNKVVASGVTLWVSFGSGGLFVGTAGATRPTTASNESMREIMCFLL